MSSWPRLVEEAGRERTELIKVLLEDRWSSRPRLAEGGQGEDISDGTAAGGQMEFQAQAGGGGGQGEDRIMVLLLEDILKPP